MRGRKPKPTRLKLIEGNPGKRPLNPSEPRPALIIPTCPSHLNPSAKAEWKRLAHEMHALGIISNLDRGALAAYCQAYGRWVEAERKLKETPALLKLPNGTVQANPWLHRHQAARAHAAVHERARALARVPHQGAGEATRAQALGVPHEVHRPARKRAAQRR